MKVLISHFFNEEYMLPWWLKHHREIFDHGVLMHPETGKPLVDEVPEPVEGFGSRRRPISVGERPECRGGQFIEHLDVDSVER